MTKPMDLDILPNGSIRPVISIDVTLVTHNSKKHIETLFQSLAIAPKNLVKLHLHIVDNASTDGTVECLHKLHGRFKTSFNDFTIHENGRNLGFGHGHNQAAACGSSPFLFVVNPDIVVAPTCFERLLAAVHQSTDDVAAWEPRQVPYEHPKVYDPVSLETSWCSGAALLLRREAFERVEGFDPKIFLYCEDVDLSWRLREAGFRLLYVPSAIVTHNTYSQPGEIKPTQFIHTRISALYLRTRFGRWRDIVLGLYLYGVALVQSQNFSGQRRALARGLLSYSWNFFHFRSGTVDRRGRYRFYRWDFAATRSGAFYNVVPDEDLESHPKVSVLVRTIGRRPLLYRALKSIENQTYRNIEVVVVEDGPESLDGFFSQFPKIEIVYHPLGENCGRSRAGNAAMKQATGQYLVFLDEDDEFYADHIEQLIAEVTRSGREVVYATAFEVATRYGPNYEIQDEADPYVANARPFSQLELCYRNYIPIQCVLFHRSLFERCSGFDPDLDQMEDWDLWLRFSLTTGPFAFVDKTTSLYRVPIEKSVFGARNKTLERYYDIATTKHDHYKICIPVNQVAREARQLIEDHTRLQEILGITPRELRALEKLHTRHHLLRWMIRLVRPIFRRLVLG